MIENKNSLLVKVIRYFPYNLWVAIAPSFTLLLIGRIISAFAHGFFIEATAMASALNISAFNIGILLS